MPNEAQPIKVLDTILGSSFLAIQAALTVLKPRQLDLTKYQILVVRDGDSEVVLFTDKAHRAPPKGYGVRLDPDVELGVFDLNVLLNKLALLKVVEKMDGANFPPIQTAHGVVQERKIDLAQYQIKVVGKKESVTVIFVDKDRAPGARTAGARRGYEVEMNAADLKVIRSNLLR